MGALMDGGHSDGPVTTSGGEQHRQEGAGAVWIYVAGAARSGSTLLGVLAGQMAQGFNCGELCELWRRLATGGACECGADLDRCDVWSAVVTEIERSLGPRFAPMVAAHDRHHRYRTRLAREFPRVEHGDRILRWATERAVEKVTGAPVIIDTSKTRTGLLAAAGRRRPMIVIHLVRDPRGVVYSWLRPKALPGGSPVLRPRSAWQSARRWSLGNARLEYALAQVTRSEPTVSSLRVTYEALAADPDRALEPLVRAIDVTQGDQPVPTGHGIAGNTVLYERAPVTLDQRWQREMSRRDQLATVALTAPLLLRYGYPLVPRGGPDRPHRTSA